MSNNKKLIYPRTEIFQLLLAIYKQKLNKDLQIEGIVKNLIGAYSETSRYHRLGASLISGNAHTSLEKNFSGSSLSALNSYITKHLRHEHMVPKSVIYKLINEVDVWKNDGEEAKNILDKCFGCAIITKDEDKVLPRSRHPGIINNELGDNFNLLKRYEDLKCSNSIKLMKFDPGAYFKPKVALIYL